VRKIVESWEKSVFCYRFFSRFCESQGADASTPDRLFTYSEQYRPDKLNSFSYPGSFFWPRTSKIFASFIQWRNMSEVCMWWLFLNILLLVLKYSLQKFSKTFRQQFGFSWVDWRIRNPKVRFFEVSDLIRKTEFFVKLNAVHNRQETN
jgi:hypothetical protein